MALGIERGKKTLSKVDFEKIFLKCSDDIFVVEPEDDSKANCLNFYIEASDFAYIWIGYFGNYEEFHNYLCNCAGNFNLYAIYNPTEKTVSFLYEPPENPDELFELEGEGAELLMEQLEEYCKSTEEVDCKTLLEDYNSDN